jgi:hypothetical protein
MRRSIRPVRHRDRQRRLRFDRLEPRQLLSFAVVATDPTPGARLVTAPPSVTVTFDQDIDPTSLSLADVRIDRVDDRGTTQPVEGVIESPGPFGDELTLTPAESPVRALVPGKDDVSDTERSTAREILGVRLRNAS